MYRLFRKPYTKKFFPEEELKKVLKLHMKWLISGGIEGKRAVIENKDMRHTDLSNINLSRAILTGNDMRHTDLSSINLSHAKLIGNDMRWIDMSYADLRYAKLTGNDMTYTDTRFIYMRDTCIEDCIIPMACPSDGAFIGWKKARHCGEAVLVKLLIPEDAKRSSATGRKCRCDKARVIEILSMKDNKELEYAVSGYDRDFVYKKGETVCEPNFCEDRFKECAEGIHFFIDRKEAEKYLL